MTNTNELTAKLKAAEGLLLNAREVSEQLRHLADNEIDSDSFAVVSENYNGREVEFERPITDLAFDAANVVDALTEALEAAEKRISSLNEQLADCREIVSVQAAGRREMRQRIAELEARTLTVKIPYLPDDCDRTEAHFKYQAALTAAGIKLQIEGE